MESKVSVIVPIYNVEKYLKRCVDSLINQTYKNLEIILVDDGSPDNCPQLCDEFSNIDSRIIVIHKKNGGLSSARNAGLDIFTGDYVVFIDSDDYIAENMIEKMVESNINIDADIVVCDYYLDYTSFLKKQKHYKHKRIVSNSQKFKMLYNSRYAIPTVVAWNKLYKRNIFNTIRYDNGKLHEDEFMICKLLNNANKILYIPERLYYYVQRDGSITSKFSLKSFDKIEAFDLRIKYFQDNKLYKFIDEAKYQKLLASISCLNGYVNSGLDIDALIVNKLKTDIKILLDELKFSKYLKLKRKIKVYLFLLNINKII